MTPASMQCSTPNFCAPLARDTAVDRGPSVHDARQARGAMLSGCHVTFPAMVVRAGGVGSQRGAGYAFPRFFSGMVGVCHPRHHRLCSISPAAPLLWRPTCQSLNGNILGRGRPKQGVS